MRERKVCMLCLTCNVYPGSDYCTKHDPKLSQIFHPEPERPSWDQTWLECAHVISKRSRCTRAQVGAVVVADDQTVISASYNGPPAGFPGEGDCSNWCPRAMGGQELSPTYDDCPAAHAEANAIARADFSRMKGATIFVSTSCCKGCAKILANAGIVRVVFKHEDGKDYRNPDETVRFLEECGIEVVTVHD